MQLTVETTKVFCIKSKAFSRCKVALVGIDFCTTKSRIFNFAINCFRTFHPKREKCEIPFRPINWMQSCYNVTSSQTELIPSKGISCPRRRHRFAEQRFVRINQHLIIHQICNFVESKRSFQAIDLSRESFVQMAFSLPQFMLEFRFPFRLQHDSFSKR